MAETLTFRNLFQYDLQQIGITIPVQLQCGNKLSVFTAKVDTGASFCIFAKVRGEELGVRYRSRQAPKNWHEGKLYLSDDNDIL